MFQLPGFILIFLTGLTVGSFLNSVIYRLVLPDFSWKNLGGLKTRSYCPNCRHTLSWHDLIPIFSFFVLKRKCRYCSQKISWQYPLVELATAVIFLLIFLTFLRTNNFTYAYLLVHLFFLFLVSCFLIIIFVYDLKHYIIPDKVVYPAILVSGIWYFVSGIFFNVYTKYEILNTIYSALGVGAFFLAIVLVSRGKWMGMGDVKLAFLIGLFLGWPNIIIALFLAFLTGAIIGLGLIIAGKKSMKSEVPFGPFLVAGTFAALFWGDKIISWYFSLL